MRSKILRAAVSVVAVAVVAVSAQFTPVVNDFSSSVAPFGTEGVLDNTIYSSAPASMRIADVNTLDDNATGVQAGFWSGNGFPPNPIRFYCMLRDTTTAGHEMGIHFNVGLLGNATVGWYHWLGMFYLAQAAFGTDWDVGMDDVLSNIGQLANPWGGNNFQTEYEAKCAELGGTTADFRVALTLIIQVKNGTIFIDDISITEEGTSVKQPLTVKGALPQQATNRLVVTPNGRVVGGAAKLSATNYLVNVVNGQARSSIVK